MGPHSEILSGLLVVSRKTEEKPARGDFERLEGYMRELAVWVICVSGFCYSLCLLFSGVVLIARSGVIGGILWGAFLFILGGLVLCAAAYALWGD